MAGKSVLRLRLDEALYGFLSLAASRVAAMLAGVVELDYVNLSLQSCPIYL